MPEICLRTSFFSTYSSSCKLLADDNICGKNLLRLASRGSAIIAELLRLGENIPDAFREEKDIRDPQQAKYAKVIFDMGYLKDPEEFERRINDSDDGLAFALVASASVAALSTSSEALVTRMILFFLFFCAGPANASPDSPGCGLVKKKFRHLAPAAPPRRRSLS